MARIKNTNIYQFDDDLEIGSFFPGSDQGDGRITKSYRIEALFALAVNEGFVTEAPIDGQPYIRQDGDWVIVPPSGVGSVFSVFGRVGAVTAQVGDYSSFYAPLVHTHLEADITDLQSYLLPTDIGTTVQAWSSALDSVTGVNTGDQTSIVGITGTKAQFNTALTDGTFMFIGDAPTSHTHLEADITDLQAYLLDAPSDGSTYGRLNGAWSVVPSSVTTVFGRSGVVTALVGDYSAFYAPLVHTHLKADITDFSVDIADINTTGTPSASTWLRGDGTWGTILGGVSSVFGRTAAVVALAGDYDAFYYTETEIDALLLGYVDTSTNQTGIAGEKTWTGAFHKFTKVGVNTDVFGGTRLGDSDLQALSIDAQSINFKDTGQLTGTAMFITPVGGSDGYTFTTKNFVDDVIVWSINGIGNATYSGVAREVESTLGLRNDFTGGEFTVFDMFNQDYDAATEVAESMGHVAIHGGGATAKEIGLWRYDTTTYTPIWELSPSNVWTFGVDINVPDEVYGVAWDGSTEVPTKNALYDIIDTLALSSHTHLLVAGATDVTATASELNLLDLSGLTVGWVLSADSATTASWKAPTGGGGGTWGSITGTLSDQTDLQSALDAKVAIAGDTMTGNLTISKASPELNLYDTSGGTDMKNWDIVATADDFRIRNLNDALGLTDTPIAITRTSGISQTIDLTANTVVNVYAGSITLPETGTATRAIEIGAGRLSNGFSYLDLVGDATYTDYGLRVIRSNTGANAISQLVHRGTGALELKTIEAGQIKFYTSNTEAMNIGSGGIVTALNGVETSAWVGTNRGVSISAAATTVFTAVGATTSSMLTVSNTTGSSGFPFTTGQGLFVKGASEPRDFAIWKRASDNNSDDIYIGNKNGTAWVWNKLISEGTQDATFYQGANNMIWTLKSDADVVLHLAADADNAVSEDHNPRLRLSQDGDAFGIDIGIEGNAGTKFTGSKANYAYFDTDSTSTGIQFTYAGTLKFEISDNVYCEDILIVANGGGSPLRLEGSGTGNANVNFIAFYENDGTTREGYVGIPSGSNSHFYVYNDNSTGYMYINGSNGDGVFNFDVQAVDFNAISDERLKHDIQPLGEYPITTNWVKYKWNEDNRPDIGVIAQDLEKTNPEFVKTDEEGMKSVKYTKLLVAKMAEKDRQIEDLETRIERLELIIKELI